MPSTRKRINKNSNQLITAIVQNISQHEHETTIKWIKGHNDNPGNDIADFYADNIDIQNRTPFIPYMDNMQIETNISTHMKALAKHKQNTVLSNIKWVNESSVIDLDSTFKILHRNIKMSSSYTQPKISFKRKQSMQSLMGLLPTNTVQFRRLRNYPNNTCKLCNQEPETQDHIWECIEQSLIIQDIFDLASKRILHSITPTEKETTQTSKTALTASKHQKTIPKQQRNQTKHQKQHTATSTKRQTSLKKTAKTYNTRKVKHKPSA